MCPCPMNIVKAVFQMKLSTLCERAKFAVIFGEKGLRIKREKSMLDGFVKYLPSARMDCTVPRFTVSRSLCAVSRDLFPFS